MTSGRMRQAIFLMIAVSKASVGGFMAVLTVGFRSIVFSKGSRGTLPGFRRLGEPVFSARSVRALTASSIKQSKASR
jgi:hypothetical protein